MRTLLNYVDFAILMSLGVVALWVQIVALADCLRTPATDFTRVYKRSKSFWGALTGVAAFFGFIYLIGPLSATLAVGFPVAPSLGMAMIFNLAAVTIAGVYLSDVKPALAEVRGRGKGNQNRGPSW